MDPELLAYLKQQSAMSSGAQMGGGLGGALGGLVGDWMSGEEKQKIAQDQEDALNAVKGLNVPGLAEQRVSPDLVYTSAFNGIKTDPALRAAQMRALESLQHEGDQAGMTPEDRMAYADAANQAGAFNRGQAGALAQHFAARGMGGSGASYAAALQSQQAGNQQNANAGLQTAAAARQRALQAIAGAGQLGGQMENQQFGEEATKAAARDAIAKYNASAANQGKYYNSGLYQSQFGNNATKTKMLQGAYQSDADYQNQQLQRNKQMGAGIGQGLGGIGGFATGGLL